MFSQTTKNPVLSSIRPVIDNSKYVRINEQAVSYFARSLGKEDFIKLEITEKTVLGNNSEEEEIGYKILINALNFCYWGEPKWAIKIDGREYDGARGLALALKKAIEDGNYLLDADYLCSLPASDWSEIVSGNVKIPLFWERLEILRSVGLILKQKFNSSFKQMVERADYDCGKLIMLLATDMPDVFNDAASYHGKKVRFYKRAQLLADNLHTLGENNLLSRKMTGQDKLTAFADYKVPQGLRKFGILEYSPDLTRKVDNMIEIPEGSEEEVEIRANCIWAVELIDREAKRKFLNSTASKIDKILWFRGQKKSSDDKPYHRTKTIWY